MSFKEHGILLYLDKELYRAFIRLQADRDLGRTYAGFLPLVEGFYRLGYLSEESYHSHMEKYSQPLNEEPTAEPVVISPEEKLLASVVSQWELHTDLKWRDHWKKEAEKHPDLVSAQKIIVLAKTGEGCEQKTRGEGI